MKKITLTKPEYTLKSDLLERDIQFALQEKLWRVIRRRTPLFMDGYRYAIDAVRARWNIDFCFFEAGHEQVKPCYLSGVLNEKAAKIWLKRMEEDVAFADSIVNEVKENIEWERKLAASIPNRDLSVEEIEKYLMEHLDWWVNFFEIGFLWFCVENIKEVVDERVKKEWKGSDIDLIHFLDAVYRPMAWPLSSVEQRDLLKISLLQGEELEKALQDHCAKYRHLSLHNIDDEYFDIDYYRGRVQMFKDPVEYAKQKELLDSADKEIDEANELMKNADIASDLKKKIEFVRWFMYLRTESVDHFMLVNGALKPVLNSLAAKLNLSFDAVLHMTYEEIATSLSQGVLSDSIKDLIIDRLNNGYAYLIAPKASYLVTGNDVDTLHHLVIPKTEEEKITQFKGQIAFKGKVIGIARVILDRRDSKDLKEGEILVTTMTSPEFVPAMKLSAGIITNEGGVLCHAAIMSRELRKPCIIGTKMATDAIKTGQKVELDADTGIITLLD